MPGWNADKWKRYEVRDFVKICVLHLLQMIQEEKGDKVVLSAGEIARLSQTHYHSIRKLLHCRWNRRKWECKFRDGTIETKKGMRLVDEVDCRSFHTGFKWGYRITPTGKAYLDTAAEWHPYWSVAKERVLKARQAALCQSIKRTSISYTWFDPAAGQRFYIRAPFQRQDFGTSNGVGISRICINMESVFAHAAKLPNPPSKEFKALVMMGVAKARKEAQEHSRPILRTETDGHNDVPTVTNDNNNPSPAGNRELLPDVHDPPANDGNCENPSSSPS